jgi:hypothetical protein
MILKKETKTLKPVSSTRKLENASIENNETHKENVQERRIDPIGQDAVEKYPKTVKAEKRFQNILIRFATNPSVRATLQSACVATSSL